MFVSVNKEWICQSNFSRNLKFADVTPASGGVLKQSRNDKMNYRSVSILPNSSKVFEKILYKQISTFFLIFS